jgi:hypothetical protein
MISRVFQWTHIRPDSYWHIRNIIFRNMYLTAVFGHDAHTWLHASPIHHVRQWPPAAALVAPVPFLVLNASSMEMGLDGDAARFVTALRSRDYDVEHAVVRMSISFPQPTSSFHVCCMDKVCE